MIVKVASLNSGLYALVLYDTLTLTLMYDGIFWKEDFWFLILFLECLHACELKYLPFLCNQK